MTEIDFNKVMNSRRDRILLFTGAFFGVEVADVVKDVLSKDIGVEALSKTLLARLNDAEKEYLIGEAKKALAAKPEVSHPLRKKGRDFEGEVTEQFLVELAKKLELSDTAHARLWRLLESKVVQDLAQAEGLDIRTGSNNGYPQDHLRKLDELPELDEIRGLGPNSQARDLLGEAVITPVEVPKRRKSTGLGDVLTQPKLFAFAEKHGFSRQVASRFWMLIDIDSVRELVEVPFEGAQETDGATGYYMEGMRALAKCDLSGIRGFGPTSQNYALLQALAKAK